MAKNTGKGYRKGAVRDRHQKYNFATGLWTVIRTSTGKILRNQKSMAKGVTKRGTKGRSGRF